MAYYVQNEPWHTLADAASSNIGQLSRAAPKEATGEEASLEASNRTGTQVKRCQKRIRKITDQTGKGSRTWWIGLGGYL